MLKEFAIDPYIFGGWDEYSRIVQDCGVEHGRLISDFPNRWRKIVWETFTANPNRTARESELMLYDLQKRLPARLVPSGRRYDFGEKALDWLRQAEREHEQKPFCAIVGGSNPRKKKHVLVASELDKDDEGCAWKVSRETNIPRTATELAALARPLFAISRQVRLVDYNMAPEALRYTKSLKQILAGLRSVNSGIREVELHLERKTDEAFFTSKCVTEWTGILPVNLELRVYRWKQRKGGKELHRRLILTDRGGLWVDQGLDVGKDGERTDAGLITEDTRKARWEDYDRNRKDAAGNGLDTTFELVDAYRVNAAACARLQPPIV